MTPAKDTENNYKQKISIPIDLDKPESQYQPIDLKIDFSNPCWAENKNIHSIKIYHEEEEIESQIYDLEHTDEKHIKSCRIVFIIPKDSSSKSNFYITYNDKTGSKKDYIDHLQITKDHLFYEPIPGQKADFDYYKITEDEKPIYAISYKGTLFGNGLAQVIAKLKPETTTVETSSIDQFASFAMIYSTDGEEIDYTGTSWASEHTTEILVDGNLMISFKIETISPEKTIKTSNIYTYYYNPTQNKKINANVNHEILKTCQIKGSQVSDGTYANLLSLKSRSSTIKNLCIGDILPYIHLKGEDEQIKTYQLPPDTDTSEEEMILSTTDDIDLGTNPWVCMDDPNTGKAHGLIFQTNKGITNNENEDGLQVKSFLQQSVKLPGLEIDTGNLFVTRNHYEIGEGKTLTLNKGLKISFNAEFATFEKEGYLGCEKEAEIFKKLVSRRDTNLEANSQIQINKPKYNLTLSIKNAPAFPFGSIISTALGKNTSYITAEIYRKGTEKTSSGSVNRLSLNQVDLELEDKTIVQKIKTITQMFDWKNISIYKKLRVTNLEQDTYLIKIYKENPLLNKKRQYIGYGIVELNEDKKIKIRCTKQAKCEIKLTNQHGEGIEKALIQLIKDDIPISESYTKTDGTTTITAPYNIIEKYTLKIIYKTITLEEKTIKLGLLNTIFSHKEEFTEETYDLKINIQDKWGLKPEIESLNPIITSNTQNAQKAINSEKISKGTYIFKDIPKQNYNLSIKYKNFEISDDIEVDDDTIKNYTFPAEYTLKLNIFDNYGTNIYEGDIKLTRNGKQIDTNIEKEKTTDIKLPPGEYEIIIKTYNQKIAQQKINIRSDKNQDIVTNQESQLHKYMIIFGIILIILSILYIIIKRNLKTGIKLTIIALLILTIFSPWWALTGENDQTEINTATTIYPPNMVTQISTKEVVSGNISHLPELFYQVLDIITLTILLIIIIITISLFLKNKYKKTNFALLIIAIFLAVLCIGVFYYAIDLIADISVGNFTGSNTILFTIPGTTLEQNIPCNWGPATGFYLLIISIILLTTNLILQKKQLFNKTKVIS